MRLQTDANGDPINVIPAYILVPAALEGAANRAVLSSSSLFPVDQDGTLNQNPGIINVVKDMAQVVVEPRLIRRTTSSGMLRRHRAQTLPNV